MAAEAEAWLQRMGAGWGGMKFHDAWITLGVRLRCEIDPKSTESFVVVGIMNSYS